MPDPTARAYLFLTRFFSPYQLNPLNINPLREIVAEQIDFERLYGLTVHHAFLVTRAKRNMGYTRRSYRQVDKATGLRSDQTIGLAGKKSSALYPVSLRRVTFYDAEHDRRFAFLTNNFALPVAR